MIVPANHRPRRVAILGGGITGLAAALRLEEADQEIDWHLYEAAPRLGGILETVQEGGYRIERSADNFLTRDPWAIDLCRRVGLEEELLPTDPARRRALVVCRGEVQRVPEGFVLMSPQKIGPILRSPILSVGGKARLAAEPFIPTRKDQSDESVASFVRRRLGREAFERLVQPLVAGIYTADPERLSMNATMHQFVEQEQQHGSLARAAIAKRRQANTGRSESGARYGLFVAPRLGMQQLIDAIENRLPARRLHKNAQVERVERTTADGWRVSPSALRESEDFDELIITLPAQPAADVLRTADAALSERLAAIEYAGCSVVCLGVAASQVTRPIDGFGFVVPAIEDRRLIAASFASYKFPGRAPDQRLLIRVFVGGALQPELGTLDDRRLIEIALEELHDLVGLQGPPELAQVARWPQRMPQYHVGHLDRVEAIEQRAAQIGLELAGAAYRGVGIPQCIHSGEQAAERVLGRLNVT